MDSLVALGIQKWTDDSDSSSIIHTFREERAEEHGHPRKIWMFGSFGKLRKNFKFHFGRFVRKIKLFYNTVDERNPAPVDR